MTTQAFDSRNKLDFEKNTEQLAEGILQIASDKSLKPTVAELSRITGIHRNTIRMRGWPMEKLEAIKEKLRLMIASFGAVVVREVGLVGLSGGEQARDSDLAVDAKLFDCLVMGRDAVGIVGYNLQHATMVKGICSKAWSHSSLIPSDRAKASLINISHRSLARQSST